MHEASCFGDPLMISTSPRLGNMLCSVQTCSLPSLPKHMLAFFARLPFGFRKGRTISISAAFRSEPETGSPPGAGAEGVIMNFNFKARGKRGNRLWSIWVWELDRRLKSRPCVHRASHFGYLFLTHSYNLDPVLLLGRFSVI